MKYAEEMKDIMNAFKVGPLEESELEEFYLPNTMEIRTGSKAASPIENIFETCQEPSSIGNSFLLLGHKGCGKSTELNEMSARLKEMDYAAYHIYCAKELDMNNPSYTDLLILMGDALFKIAEEKNCVIDEQLMRKVKDFWKKEIIESGIYVTENNISAEAGVSAKTPSLLAPLINLFAHIKGNIKYSEEKRSEYKEIVSRRSGEWLSMINIIADDITAQVGYKQPIVVFEDLDKINPQHAWDIFDNYAATLTGFTFPVIYTFPIALAYEPRFAALRGYFKIETLPMIKQRELNGRPYEQGKQTIISIVKKRAKLELFDDDVLELMIEKTGGSLRDLFHVITSAARLSKRQNFMSISLSDAQYALTALQTELRRTIYSKHYKFLEEMCKYEEKRISTDDQEMLLEMMQAGVVMEYNGEGWHDVHPLIADFLKEIGRVPNE